MTGIVKSAGPAIYVKVRADLALVSGWSAERAVRFTSEAPMEWSRSGRGWVIDAARVPDVIAFAQSGHLLVVVSDITPQQQGVA